MSRYLDFLDITYTKDVKSCSSNVGSPTVHFLNSWCSEIHPLYPVWLQGTNAETCSQGITRRSISLALHQKRTSVASSSFCPLKTIHERKMLGLVECVQNQ